MTITGRPVAAIGTFDRKSLELALAPGGYNQFLTTPGKLVMACNGNAVTEAVLEKGATEGSTQGDATVPGTPLRPSIVEVSLPRGTLVAGQNVLTLAKPEGSWHAYDAVGVFEPQS